MTSPFAPGHVTPPSGRRWTWKSIGGTLLRGAGFALCIASVLGFGGRWNWRLELFSHFPVQYFWCLVAGTVVACANRRKREAALWAVFAAVNAGLVVPAYWGRPAPPDDLRRLRAVTFNVFGYHQRPERIIEFLRKAEADLIVLLEITPHWETALADWNDDYPYRQIEPLWDPFGIAVLSRIPFDEVQIHHLGGMRRPSVLARLESGGQPLTVIATHPYPPRTARLAHLRLGHLNDLARLVESQSGALMVLGDLNCTPWSPLFRDFLKQTHLLDSRNGFGVQATWPTWFAPIRIPIDHCLVSPEIAVYDRWVGPDLGSDHFPVFVDFSIPKR